MIIVRDGKLNLFENLLQGLFGVTVRSFLIFFFTMKRKFLFCYYLLFCFFLFGYLIIDKFEVLLIIFLSYMERNMSREKGKSILSIVFT